jgi:hypothetical protein
MAPSTPAFDPTRYPRTYVPSLGNRAVWISFGGLLAVGGVFGVWYSLVAGNELGPKGPAVTISLSLMLVLLGGYLIVSMLSSKVILRADAIEVRNLLSSKTMLRQEIMGRRFFFSTGTIELIPREEYKKKLKVAFLTNPDAAFAAWFESIPDLDERNQRKPSEGPPDSAPD